MSEEEKSGQHDEFYDEEFEDEKRHKRIDLEAGYGRRKADHPIKCLDCGFLRKMYWKEGMSCPMCHGERFFPMVFVEDLDKATGKSKKTLLEKAEKKLHGLKMEVLARYKKWLLYFLIAINIGMWGRFIILNVDAFKGEMKFEWPRFYHCQDCRRYFSRTIQADVGRARCRFCRSIKVKRVKSKRIAR